MEDRKELQTKPVPEVVRPPYPAYRGNEPYIFVSYAHNDKDLVFPEIKRFTEAGFHVWYDEGISPGYEWSDEIAEALTKCTVFVVMLTPTSAPREAVLNEISFALDEGKPFLAIYLENTELTPGVRLRISRKQAILKYKMTEEAYANKCTEAFLRLGLKQVPAQPADTPGTENAGPAAAKEEPTAAVNAEPTPAKENGDPAEKPGGDVSIKRLDELVKNFLGTNKVASREEAAETTEVFSDDSPEDARKRANGDLVRIDGFDLEHGLLRGYFGTEKDITVPKEARLIGARAFDRCRSFLESVDLNQVSSWIPGPLGTFSNCFALKTVRIPETVKTVTPNMFFNCPNLTVYVRRSQVSPDFEDRFMGKKIVYIEEE